ncbi:tetratricopeptide repeat protein [Nocardia sp. NBC_01388]
MSFRFTITARSTATSISICAWSTATVSSANNLAYAYAYAYESAGRLDEAITLFEATHSDCERILGPDHPITRATQENLAVIRADRNVEE